MIIARNHGARRDNRENNLAQSRPVPGASGLPHASIRWEDAGDGPPPAQPKGWVSTAGHDRRPRVFNHVELEAMARHRRDEAYREAEARQRVRQAKRQIDRRETCRSSMTRSDAR